MKSSAHPPTSMQTSRRPCGNLRTTNVVFGDSVHGAATRSTSASKSTSTAVSNRPPTAPTHTSAESSSGVDDRQSVAQLKMSFASAAIPAAMSTAISTEAMLNHSLIQTSSKPCTPPAALLVTSSAVISSSVVEQRNLSTSPIDLSSFGGGLSSTNKLCQSSTSTSTATNQPSTTREQHLLPPTTTQPVVTDSSWLTHGFRLNTSFSCVLLNARNLVNKNQFGEFELILHNNMFHIIAVCETWLKSFIPNNLIDGNDKYYVYRKDRYNQRGGGVCFFIAKLLDCTINVINLGLKYDSMLGYWYNISSRNH